MVKIHLSALSSSSFSTPFTSLARDGLPYESLSSLCTPISSGKLKEVAVHPSFPQSARRGARLRSAFSCSEEWNFSILTIWASLPLQVVAAYVRGYDTNIDFGTSSRLRPYSRRRKTATTNIKRQLPFGEAFRPNTISNYQDTLGTFTPFLGD